MRFVFELTIFMIIAMIAVSAGAVVIWIIGIRLEITPSKSIAFSAIGLCFVLPGAANIWTMMRGSDDEGIGERACAGIRGFGMLLCAVAVVIPLAVANAHFRHGGILFVIGSILWWGTVPFEYRFTTARLRAKGVIVEGEQDAPADAERPRR